MTKQAKHIKMNRLSYAAPKSEAYMIEPKGVVCASPYDSSQNETYGVYGTTYGDGDFD